MFVLRSIINHELYTDNVKIDGEAVNGVAGWTEKKNAEEYLNTAVREKLGKYHVDDWIIIEIDDKKYYKINDKLNNDSEYKAFYYNSGVFEILNTTTGRFTRYEENND